MSSRLSQRSDVINDFDKNCVKQKSVTLDHHTIEQMTITMTLDVIKKVVLTLQLLSLVTLPVDSVCLQRWIAHRLVHSTLFSSVVDSLIETVTVKIYRSATCEYFPNYNCCFLVAVLIWGHNFSFQMQFFKKFPWFRNRILQVLYLLQVILCICIK